MTVRCKSCNEILGEQVGHLTFRRHAGRRWIGDTWVSWCARCKAQREPLPGRAELAAEIDQTLWTTVECAGCGQRLCQQIGRYVRFFYRGAYWLGQLEALTCEDCDQAFVPERDPEAEARILGPRETAAA